jgi:Flp pilus assembly protein TadG
MPTLYLLRQRIRSASLARRFIDRVEGVAAVEFALIVPIMAVLFLGAVEMSQAVTANRRVTQVGTTVGDIIARASSDIYDTNVLDIMKVGKYLLDPFNPTTLKVDVNLVGTSNTSDTDTKQKWTCSYDGANPSSINCSCPNQAGGGTAYTLPTGLVTKTDQFVIVANVQYGYKPPLFDNFMKSSYGGAKSGGVYTMTETVYLKPRNNCPKVIINNQPACGC